MKMQIHDDFEFDDLAFGLQFKVVPGNKCDCLRITKIPGRCDNRDLWFTRDGRFAGTGSCINNPEAVCIADNGAETVE